MENDAAMEPSASWNPRSGWFRAVLVMLCLLAFAIRLKDIQAPGHLVEREYNSAIFARAFYFEGNASIAPWRQQNALQTRAQFPLLEPPVTEYLVSWIFRLAREERIEYARYLTSLFWIIGGVFLYRIARKMISAEAAPFALLYYLFVPFGIVISRSFQPDALMMMMFLISLYLILRYFDEPSWRRLIYAAVLTGLTLLFRPLVIFALLGAFVGLAVYHKRSLRGMIDAQLLAFLAIGVAFPLAFYGWSHYLAEFRQAQPDLSYRFRPWMLVHRRFWQSWLETGLSVILPSFLMTAMAGFFLLRQNRTRVLLVSQVLTYLVFGLVFPYHINTHPYYHIQLIPVIALGAAPAGAALLRAIIQAGNRRWWLPAGLILAVALLASYLELKDQLYIQVFEPPALAEEIGELIRHSPRTVMIARYYGQPLEYYGEFSGAPWPVRIDDPFYRPPDARELSVQERLDGLGFVPEYFVITDFALYERKHVDLAEYLQANCQVYARSDAYLIYSNCRQIVRKPAQP